LGAQGLALDEVLDWLLLFRAYLLRAAGHPWSDVAGVIGVHRHTLAHLVHRLAGVGLRDFSADTVVRARSTFIRAVMDPLGAAPRRK
jgi:hypothetical protein